MIVNSISEAPANRPICGRADGTYEVWAEGEPKPSWAVVVTPLNKAKAEKLSELHTMRDIREQSAFTYLTKKIESDPISVQRIGVAAATAQMAVAAGVPYSLEWSCADNSLLPLDAVGVLGMMQALGSYGLGVHMAYRSHKTAINALASVAAVNAYDISKGWPE